MSGQSLVAPAAARGWCEGLCAQPHTCQTAPPSLLVPWTRFQSGEGDPALAELGCPSLWEQADQQFVPYSWVGKVMVTISCGGS